MSRTLPYDSTVYPEPRAPRPLWVYAVAGAYLLVLGALALSPAILSFLGDDAGIYPPLIATVAAMVLCELALLFVPVRVASRRPITRRSLWIPLLGSAGLAGLLGMGAALALSEYWHDPDGSELAIAGTAVGVWGAWTLVFWHVASRTSPDSVATKLHRWLVAGSVLELLIAVPTHIVVRRRTECCAGLSTGMAICVGVLVMLLAFGPSVGFLYYRRWQQVRRP